MSSQIKPVLVKDDILLCDSQLAFAVQKGGQNVSFQRFTSNAVSSTSHSYTIQCPSTSVVLDREIMWHTEMSITVSGVPKEGKFLVDYGNLDAFAPFPLHQNVVNLQAQINNTTVSLAVQQVLDVMLRNMDREELARYNSTTPVMLDNYGKYEDILEEATEVVISQGATPADAVSTRIMPYNSPFLSYRGAVNPQCPPRGSFEILSITGNTVQAEGATDTKNVVITVAITEPLMLSPFVFGDVKHKAQGIYGVGQINITAQMDATGKRCFRWINDSITYDSKAISNISYDNTKSYVECRFLTPHPSDLLPEVNILPYASFVNYQTVSNDTVGNGIKKTITSSNLQLNSVPDKLFLFIRNKQSLQTGNDADAYCYIESIRLLWNNNSGLLSSASAEALYKMSVEAGSRQSWLEYQGVANSYNLSSPNTLNVVSTTGSVLTLDFARHIALSEDFYAPSSLGAFNLQVEITYVNTTGKTITPELNVMTMSSGIFATQNSQSSVYTGVLNKQQVLDASLQEPMAHSQLKRYVGGGLFDSIKSIASSVLPLAKTVLSSVPHPVAQTASSVLGALGMGKGGAMSAGAMSAGAETGGKRMKHRLL